MKSACSVIRAALLCLLFLMSGALPAGASLTEQQALKEGMANSYYNQRLESQLDAARGEVEAAGLWDNPTIEYSRESIDVSGGTSVETTLEIQQRINMAGVKGLEKQQAQLNLQASESHSVQAKSERKLSIREQFYQTLAAIRKTDTLANQKQRLESVASIIEKRTQKGDSSRFDLLRIQKQLALVASQYSQAQANLSTKQSRLFELINSPPQPVKGTLLPDSQNVMAMDPDLHPAIKALQAEKAALETAAKAAARKKWPDITLSLGRKEVDEGGQTANGTTFSVGVELPLLDRGTGQQRTVQSLAHQVQADIALQRRHLQTRYEIARSNYLTHRENTLRLQALAFNPDASLSRLAEISYHAGELGVMELLDAYASDQDTTDRYIDSALAARLAYIQLQYLRGE